MKTQEVYVCELCGKYHAKDSKTYFMVRGNILIGKDAEILGDNFCDNVLLTSLVFCTECLIATLNQHHKQQIVYRG